MAFFHSPYNQLMFNNKANESNYEMSFNIVDLINNKFRPNNVPDTGISKKLSTKKLNVKDLTYHLAMNNKACDPFNQSDMSSKLTKMYMSALNINKKHKPDAPTKYSQVDDNYSITVELADKLACTKSVNFSEDSKTAIRMIIDSIILRNKCRKLDQFPSIFTDELNNNFDSSFYCVQGPIYATLVQPTSLVASYLYSTTTNEDLTFSIVSSPPQRLSKQSEIYIVGSKSRRIAPVGLENKVKLTSYPVNADEQIKRRMGVCVKSALLYGLWEKYSKICILIYRHLKFRLQI